MTNSFPILSTMSGMRRALVGCSSIDTSLFCLKYLLSSCQDHFSGKIVGFIPSAVFVESNAVGARLTGSKKSGMNLTKRIEEALLTIFL